MAGLFHTLGIGAESLFAARQGVDTTGHNIANAQTEGYSRQRVNLTQREPSETHGIIIGNGVYVQDVERHHDKFVEKQYNQSNQTSGSSDFRFEGMNAISQIYSPELAASISDEMSTFFNAMQDLSASPDDLTARTAVKETAQNLINSFHRVDSDLVNSQQFFNSKVENFVQDSTGILRALADINVKIKSLEGGNTGMANDLRDQRDRMLTKLNNLMDINYYEDDKGMLTVRGPGDVLMVEGNQHLTMQTSRSSENKGFLDVVVMDQTGNLKNLTSKFTKGQMGAALDLRDNYLPGLIKANDELAFHFAEQINSIHRDGFGLGNFKEVNGRDFFAPISGPKGAASALDLNELIQHSTDAISAAMTPGSIGDNIVLNKIIALKDQRILDGGSATFTEFYANTVGKVGLEVVRSENVKSADQIILSDLKARKDAVSGVSLDEEAMNLLKWQTAFTASSKLITTVDEMLDTVLSLKR